MGSRFRPGRRRAALRRLAALILVPAGLFGLVELALRVAGYRPQPGMRAMLFGDPDRAWAERGLRYRPSDRLFWEFVPGDASAGEESRVNRLGFRGSEPAAPVAEGPPPRRVICLGDSSTYGHGLGQAETYPACLERRLAGGSGGPFEVWNGGVPGYSSHQGSVYLMLRALPHRPWAVTIYYGRNDGEPALFFSDAEQARAARSRLQRLLAGSHLAGGLRELLFPLGSVVRARLLPPGSRLARRARVRVGVEEYEANLAAMVDRARAAGVRAVICTAPYPSAGGSSFHSAQAEAARRVALRHGAALADFDRLLSGRDDLFADDCHPNVAGAAAIAELLAPVIAGLER